MSFWEVGLCVLSSASDAFTVKGKIVLHLFTCSQSSSYVILFIIIYFLKIAWKLILIWQEKGETK